MDLGSSPPALVIKRSLTNPIDHRLDLRGGQMAIQWHRAHATVASGQCLRQQAERRVVGGHEEPPVAADLRFLQ